MTPAGTAEAVQQLRLSPRLRQRRFARLPLRGDGTPFTELQGRVPGDSTTPADLADLISSISTVGVLQPVLVEEIPGRNGGPPTTNASWLNWIECEFTAVRLLHPRWQRLSQPRC